MPACSASTRSASRTRWHPRRRIATRPRPGRSAAVDVDPELARFGAWYELFPRSFGGLAGVEAQLPRLAGLGFDVVYLTPIHPIGVTDRKGPDNALRAGEGDPGSPWAIGGVEGGHTAIHPDLGTIDDFDRLVATRASSGSRSRSTSRSSARPIIPGCASTPSGSRGGPTAR